jgi:hypothetical protein
MITIRRLGSWNETLDAREGEREAVLVTEGAYPAGSAIQVVTDNKFIWFKADAALEKALLYVPAGAFVFRVPAGAELTAYPPCSFAAKRSMAYACAAEKHEIAARRNLALNPADMRGPSFAYPHATANVETRNEADFAARNVISGTHANDHHGSWPYQSWGVGMLENAAVTVDFGHEVLADTLAVYLRADFPHDAWWTQATAVLSDGTEKTFPLMRTSAPQTVSLGEHRIAWIRLERFIKADDPSPFPSLSRLEVYGCEIL